MERKLSLRWFAMIFVFVIVFSLPASTMYAADNYPSRPISVFVGASAGGSADIFTKSLTEPASKILGQPLPLIFKPGGMSSVSLSVLKNEKPDGYTIAYLTVGGVRASFMQKVPYDPLEDFTYILQVGEWQFGIFDRPDSPWKNLKELIKYAKENPGKIRYGSPGVGSAGHLAMAKLGMDAGINWKHVPFEGDVGLTSAILGGHIEVVASATAGYRNYYDAGKMRFLAVFMEKPITTFPGVPTLMELGYNVLSPGSIGFVGPKGLPEPVVTKLHDTFKKCMADPQFLKIAELNGISPYYQNAKDLKEYLRKMVTEEKELINKIRSQK